MFDPGKEEHTITFQFSNETTQRSHSSDNWPSKPAPNFTSYRGWNSTELQFKTELNKFDDDSRICSPPLWTTSPTRSPQNGKYNYQSLSPSSRTEAIARGQRKLMEMVRSMPESNYELSLKDLVERQTGEEVEEESSMAEERKLNPYKNVYRKEGNTKRNDKKIIGNIDGGGFYLKMMFPTSLGSKKKKKKNESLGNNYQKVSPRPSISDESSVKAVPEKEWWKKSPSASAESDSGVSSMNSGSVKSSGSSSSSSSSNNDRRYV